MTVADTSLMAYDKVLEKLNHKQRVVLDGFKRYGPITNKELAKRMGIEINKITPRSGELRDQGLIQLVGSRRVDGFFSKVWEAVYIEQLF